MVRGPATWSSFTTQRVRRPAESVGHSGQILVATDERNARIGPALAAVPQFKLSDRNYYLLNRPLSALVGLRYPDVDDWKNPALFWPDDRSWFAATDVDFWSLYVGGTAAFASELGRRVTTPWEFVDRSERLPIEN